VTCITDVQCFLNVDVDIESSEDLTPRIDGLAPHAIALDRPPGMASLELDSEPLPTSPEPLIVELVRLVKRLPPPALALWKSASRRVFDIGIRERARACSRGPSALAAHAARRRGGGRGDRADDPWRQAVQVGPERGERLRVKGRDEHAGDTSLS